MFLDFHFIVCLYKSKGCFVRWGIGRPWHLYLFHHEWMNNLRMKETDSSKRWEAVSHQSLKGGIISLDHFCVCERGGLVIIKAGSFRLLQRLAIFLVISSLVVGLMSYLGTEDGPGDEGRFAECYFLLFLIFLVFVREIFAFFRSGRIELDKESGSVHIRHGLFFRRRREVSVRKENLKICLYQNRQGGRDRDIGWGHLVLSLKRVDVDSEELILCKARKTKRLIIESFEIIHEYFGQGEIVGIDDFIRKETSKQPCTADPEWNALAIQTRTKAPHNNLFRTGLNHTSSKAQFFVPVECTALGNLYNFPIRHLKTFFSLVFYRPAQHFIDCIMN